MLNRGNIFVLLKGSIISQFLPIISYPLITRMYSTKEFGLYSTLLSIITTFTVFIILKLDQALSIADKSDKIKLIRLSVLINFILSFIIFIVMISLIQLRLITSFDSTNAILMVLAIFLNGLINLFIGLNVSEGNFKFNASNQIIRSIILTFLQILFGLMGLYSKGLIIAFIIAQSISVFFLIQKNRSYIIEIFSFKMIIHDFRLMLKEYKDFPFIMAPTHLINTLGMTLPIILISSTFGLVSAGLYGLVTRAFMTPMSMISLAISQPLLKEMSDNKDKIDELKVTMTKAIVLLSIISIVPLNLMSGFMEFIFSSVFSEEWKKAGIIALYIIPWISVNFILSPISNLYTVLRKQHINLIMNILITTARVLVIVICFYININFEHTIIIFGIVSFIMAIIQINILLRLVNIPFKMLGLYILLPLVLSLIFSLTMSVILPNIIYIILIIIIITIYFAFSLNYLKELIK